MSVTANDSDECANFEHVQEAGGDTGLISDDPQHPPQGFVAVMKSSTEIREVDLDDDEVEEDETLAERLWGLTEMFPERLRNASHVATDAAWSSTKWLYHVGRIGIWVAASSAAILAFPVMFETERAQMEEQQMQQQRQILLGPNAAVSSGMAGSHGMMGAMSQMAPPPMHPVK